MEPGVYIPAYLEHRYLASHPELTPAARGLVRDGVRRHPEKFADDEHAQALLAYAGIRDGLLRELDRLENAIDDDDEYERRRGALFDATRLELAKVGEADRLCIDAQLVDILLADVPLDSCINDAMELEARTRTWLSGNVPGFDLQAPHYWDPSALEAVDGVPESVCDRTRRDPVMVGWLHTLGVLAQACLGTGRYRAAASYARQMGRGAGFEDASTGTVLLALARLEDEDGFFEAARRGSGTEDSPWYLLGRTLLLYKLGRRKNARRALRDFVGRCEGGAFFLLNPTYLAPYLPARPPVDAPWKLTHQALWEADGIIVDTPDFVTWASGIDGVEDASERFAELNGF